MEISNEYCDLENEEGDHKPLIKKCLRHKSSKKTLETNSTSSCTFEIEKLYLTPCSKSKKNSKGFSICKSHKKHSNIAERLNYLQQITDNTVKFMRIEKEGTIGKFICMAKNWKIAIFSSFFETKKKESTSVSLFLFLFCFTFSSYSKHWNLFKQTSTFFLPEFRNFFFKRKKMQI